MLGSNELNNRGARDTPALEELRRRASLSFSKSRHLFIGILETYHRLHSLDRNGDSICPYHC